MPQHIPPREPSLEAFEAQYLRFLEAAECLTQQELADFLHISRSSVSDAKRRKHIPLQWLMTLFEKARINPEWILRGGKAKYLMSANAVDAPVSVVQITEVRPPEACSAQELVNELVRRALLESDIGNLRKEASACWLPLGKADGES